MKKSIPLMLAVISLLFSWEPPAGQAEVVIAESMECVLGKSDRVVVGKATKVEKVKGADTKEYQVVTLTVSNTFKGKTSESVSFVIPGYIDSDYAQQWAEEGIPILFCLMTNNGNRVPFSREQFEWVLREDGNGPNAVLLGKSKHYWTGCKPCLTRDFTVLTKKEDILKFVEIALKGAPNDRKPRYHTLVVPDDTALYEHLRAGSAVMLIVPVDEKLEQLGRQWCNSTSPFQRKEGARVLSYFKNAENVKVLKLLLNDPATAVSTTHQTVPGKLQLQLVSRKKVYYVRQAAFTALGKLGVDVPRPLLEEVLEGNNEPKSK